MADRPQPLCAPQFAPPSGPAGPRNFRGLSWPSAGPGPGTCCQIPVKRTCGGGAAPLHANPLNPEHPHRAVERKRDYVADPHGMGGGSHAPAVEAHEARRCEGRGIGARAYYARMPQPFVDTLAIEIFRSGAQDGSLPLCSSCSLSAASLAKGEFGSGCLSRPPELPNGLA
jgi:hypothetical protein